MKRVVYVSIILAVVLGGAFLLWRGKTETKTELIISPKVGDFEITVLATGELKAKHSVDIQGPAGLRKANIWQVKISNLLPEGTIVKKDDVVAELDKTDLANKIKDTQNTLAKSEAQYTQAKLDCTLTLAAARNDIINLRYALEENKLKKEQLKYEAPAAQRQAQIEYEKAERALTQAETNYLTKVKQATAKMAEVSADLNKHELQLKQFTDLLGEFSVRAPDNGMLIYLREWNGKKISIGSTVHAWDGATVATLPDLTKMESVMFVNEIDIQKIKMDLPVSVGLDAAPDKKLTGTIDYIANIGEQRPNSESKVFEVHVAIHEQDTTLRPAMTTSNKILIQKIPKVMFIPLECLHIENGKYYVYKKNANLPERVEVQIGAMNDNEVIILKGLAPTDKIYLSLPTLPSPPPTN